MVAYERLGDCFGDLRMVVKFIFTYAMGVCRDKVASLIPNCVEVYSLQLHVSGFLRVHNDISINIVVELSLDRYLCRWPISPRRYHLPSFSGRGNWITLRKPDT
jgi:hypothetical protein